MNSFLVYKGRESCHFVASVYKAAKLVTRKSVFFHSELIPLPEDALQQTSVVVDVSSCTYKWLKFPSSLFPVFWGLTCCKRDSISPHGYFTTVVSLGRPGTQIWGQTPWNSCSWLVLLNMAAALKMQLTREVRYWTTYFQGRGYSKALRIKFGCLWNVHLLNVLGNPLIETIRCFVAQTLKSLGHC